MPTDGAEVEAGSDQDARPPKAGLNSPKARLLTLADLDRRTTAAKRAHDLISSVTTDLGGVENLAVGEQQIVQRAAMLGTMAEDIETRWLLGEPVDATVLATLANAQRRLFESVGLRRRPKDMTPSVAEYLEHVSKAGAR